MTQSDTSPSTDHPTDAGAATGAADPGDAAAAAPPAMRWAMAALALLAFAGSVVLIYQSVGQTALPGCGPESGCDQVLGSVWGKWFALPVAVPAALLYALMFIATFALAPARPRQHRQFAWAMLWIGAMTALGAAAWFGILQGLVIGAFCRYCTGVHAAGGLLAVVVLSGAPRVAHSLPWRPASLTLLGLIPLAALGLGQLSSHLVQAAPDTEVGSLTQNNGAAATNADGQVVVLGGRMGFQPDGVPTLGPDDAEVWMVYLFDYTCPTCRHMHPQLNAARERYGDQLGILPMPAPLDADCNPLVRETQPSHVDACELASLSLAVWKADPDQFEAFDHYLFTGEEHPAPEAARAHAVELVGEDALDEAIASGWPSEHLQRSTGLYRGVGQLTGRTSIPTMIVGTLVLGPSPNAEALFEALEQRSPLRPADGEGASDTSETSATDAASQPAHEHEHEHDHDQDHATAGPESDPMTEDESADTN